MARVTLTLIVTLSVLSLGACEPDQETPATAGHGTAHEKPAHGGHGTQAGATHAHGGGGTPAGAHAAPEGHGAPSGGGHVPSVVGHVPPTGSLDPATGGHGPSGGSHAPPTGGSYRNSLRRPSVPHGDVASPPTAANPGRSGRGHPNLLERLKPVHTEPVPTYSGSQTPVYTAPADAVYPGHQNAVPTAPAAETGYSGRRSPVHLSPESHTHVQAAPGDPAYSGRNNPAHLASHNHVAPADGTYSGRHNPAHLASHNRVAPADGTHAGRHNPARFVSHTPVSTVPADTTYSGRHNPGRFDPQNPTPTVPADTTYSGRHNPGRFAPQNPAPTVPADTTYSGRHNPGRFAPQNPAPTVPADTTYSGRHNPGRFAPQNPAPTVPADTTYSGRHSPGRFAIQNPAATVPADTTYSGRHSHVGLAPADPAPGLPPAPEPTAPHWAYHGTSGITPDRWANHFKDCGKYRQSPVDLPSAYDVHTLKHKNFPPFKFVQIADHNTQSLWTITNNGHSVEAVPKTPHLMVSGGGLNGYFVVDQFHFHWPAEHTIGGERFAMEMHVVMHNVEYTTFEEALKHTGGVSVMAFLFQVSGTKNFYNADFQPLTSQLADIRTAGTQQTFAAKQFLQSLMEGGWHRKLENQQFYRYEGSLTTPPCTESVTWTVFGETLKISKHQMEEFMYLKDSDGFQLDLNYRPIQHLYGRNVYFSDGTTLTRGPGI